MKVPLCIYRLSLQFVIMSEEDLTKLLVRVDIPDIKTQVITANLKCAGNHVYIFLICTLKI